MSDQLELHNTNKKSDEDEVKEPFLKNSNSETNNETTAGKVEQNLGKDENSIKSKVDDCFISRYWTKVTKNPKVNHAKICLEFFIVRVIMTTADVGTDFGTAVSHFYAGNPYWGTLTIIPIFLPFLVQVGLVIFNMLQNLKGKCLKQVDERDGPKLSLWKTFWHLPLVQTFRNLRMFFSILLMDTSISRNAIFVNRLKLAAIDFGIWESFLESAPQFILQSYIIVQTGQISYLQIVGTPISFLSLLNSAIMIFFTQRLGRYPDSSPTILAKVFIAPFVFLQLLGPTFTIILIAIYLKESLLFIIALIASINFLSGKFYTRNVSEFEKLYPNLQRKKDECKRELNKIVASSASTSWISTSSVLATNYKLRSKFILIISFISQTCHIAMVTVIFLLVNSERAFHLFRSSMTYCTTEAYLSSQNLTGIRYSNLTDYFSTTILVAQQCQHSNECSPMIRICGENENPSDIFFHYLGPIAIGLLLLSMLASVGIFYLGDYENVLKYTKVIFCGKPFLHYTLIHDWTHSKQFDKIRKVKGHLNEELLNRNDPMEQKTCMHMISQSSDGEASEILKMFLELGGDETIDDIYGSQPQHYMTPKMETLLKDFKETERKDVEKSTPPDNGRVWKVPPLHWMCKNKKKVLFTLSYSIGGNMESVDGDMVQVYDFLFQWLEELASKQLKNNDQKIQETNDSNTTENTQQPNRSFTIWLKYISWLIKQTDVEQVSASQYSAYFGHPNILKLFMDLGSSPDEQDIAGRGLLHIAAMSGFKACLEIVLDKGATIELKNSDGWTAAHYAASFGHAECLAKLINPTTIEEKNRRGWTPIFEASLFAHKDCIKLLIESNAVINISDPDGDTPLHLVAKSNDFTGTETDADECFKILLNAGADWKAKNNKDKTPIEDNPRLKRFKENEPQLFIEKKAEDERIQNTDNNINDQIIENQIKDDQ